MATGSPDAGCGTELGACFGRALMSDKRRNMWRSRIGAQPGLGGVGASQIVRRATNDVKLRHNI